MPMQGANVTLSWSMSANFSWDSIWGHLEAYARRRGLELLVAQRQGTHIVSHFRQVA